MYENSLTSSLFLAKLIGLYLIIFSLGVFINRESFMDVRHDILAHPLYTMIMGMITLVLGLLIVLTHNLWTSDWRVIITIIGWLALVQSTLRILFPKLILKFFDSVGPNFLNILTGASLFLFVLGLYLTYKGFSKEL